MQLDSDISEYTYERTMKMEERYNFLREIQLGIKDKARDIQLMADAHHAVRYPLPSPLFNPTSGPPTSHLLSLTPSSPRAPPPNK